MRVENHIENHLGSIRAKRMKEQMEKYPLLTEKVIQRLNEIGSWFADACMDIAHDADSFSFPKEIKELKAQGIKKRYIPEALADRLYNDCSTANDLCGDRMYDALQHIGWKYEDKETWGQAVDYFTSRCITHINGLNEALKK